MKLNNKGMSIIEIVLTFALIMVMVIGMITIVFNYREKASISLEKLDLDTFKNTLTKTIQDDILEKGIKEMNLDGECSTLTDLNSCVNIVFTDGSEKAFGTSIVNNDNKDSIENKFLYYDGIKYKLRDSLPTVIPTGREMSEFQMITIQDSNILSTDSMVLENGTIVALYSIDVYISHFDFDEDFGIHIVAYSENKTPFDNNIEESVPKNFAETILANNTLITSTPNLSAASSVCTSTSSSSSNSSSTGACIYDKSGLYKSTATNSGSPTYYFRGAVENNYVSFAGFIWRIIRINEDGTVRMILANGIDNNKQYVFDSNNVNYTYMYYTGSDVAKPTLESWYTTNIASNIEYSSKVASGNYFCEQAKVKEESSWTSGNTTMTVYSSYTPNFKCATDGNGKGIVNASIGLITYDELVFAGGNYSESNFSYYLCDTDRTACSAYWTMSPAGAWNDEETAFVWIVDVGGDIITWGVDGEDYLYLKPVINLKADTTVTGSGTAIDPYIIEPY